jgi:hypothetical protein
MSWVMGFGRHVEVVEIEHLRKAVAEGLAAVVEGYAQKPAPVCGEDPGEGRLNTWLE